MYDAKKLRRGQLFNVSITEVILLILFLLLLLFSIFYKELEKKYSQLEDKYIQLAETKESVPELLEQIQDYKDTTGYTGPAQIKDELAELGPSNKDLKEVLYFQKDKISDLEKKIEDLKAELEALNYLKDKVNIEDLDTKLEDIAKFNEVLKEAEPEQVDKLIEGLEALLEQYSGDFDRLLSEIEKLAGNAIPVCWPKAYPDMIGQEAERIFTIRLQPEGIWVEPDFNNKFETEYSYLPINNNYMKPLSESLFLKSFNDLYLLSEAENSNALSITEQRRCRHEVRIFDELSNDKNKYKRQMKAIEAYFYIFEFRDDDYCQYRKNSKKDNQCLNK